MPLDLIKCRNKKKEAFYCFTQTPILSKTQLVDDARVCNRPIIVKALTRILGPDEPDRVLCPVRAVKHYIRRTASFRNNWKKLFISFWEGHRGENTISGWLKKV